MPTYSTSPLSTSSPPGPRHAAPDRDRVGSLLTASWAALHVAAVSLLGLGVYQAESSHAVPMSASVPDQPYA